jgi:DNA-binding helix-hairpin-helix protein with protein kinase domain
MSAATPCALHPGQPFLTVNRRRGTVDELLGAGGQGEVYLAHVDGLPFALKWYHRHYVEIDTGLRSRLERAVQRGAPTADFLWPFDLVEIEGSGSFGYFMPLRGANFVGMRDLIAPPPRRVELNLAKRAQLCLQIAHSFHELHASGFCYQDINFGNIFFDPATARILICDNDNVNVDGAEASIYGTRKFMAPEVVRREALPSSRTDLYSMAVLFFYTLLGWHPLDGRREHELGLMNAEAELQLYGSAPIFLFDPVTHTNGPVPGFHDAIVARWESLPGAVRALFIRAFTTGLHDPETRVLETQWRTALSMVPGAVHACAGCGFEHVAEIRGGQASTRTVCLACAAPLPPPLFLIIGQQAERLAVGETVRDGVARIEAHPTRPELTGLRNLGGETWRAGLPDGSAHQVPPGQAVRLLPGIRIDFGNATGQIVLAEQAA